MYKTHRRVRYFSIKILCRRPKVANSKELQRFRQHLLWDYGCSRDNGYHSSAGPGWRTLKWQPIVTCAEQVRVLTNGTKNENVRGDTNYCKITE